jgi:hypothetical protein
MRRCFVILLQAAAPITLLVLASVLLLHFSPEQYSLYPQCPIYYYFGILCPGCGTTRAIAALLHGNVNQALRLNPLTTLMLPIAIGYGSICYLRMITRWPFRWPQPHPWAINLTLAVAIVFTIARNI